jgi:hypothetical protein
MDYRELLKKYINHVGYCEGTTFIHMAYPDDMGFTAEEVAELEKLDAEVLAENVKQGNPT